jgi:hypothetical protein
MIYTIFQDFLEKKKGVEEIAE